jgi:hypothetical protein
MGSARIHTSVPEEAGAARHPENGGLVLKVATARSGASSPGDWLPVLNGYRTPSQTRSAIELLVTAVPFVLLWVGAWACLRWSYWLSLAVAVPAESIRCIRFALWDEERGRMISFRQLRTLRRSATRQQTRDGCRG